MEQICRKYADIHKKYARNMHKYVKICIVYAENAQICKKYVFNMQGICNKYAYISTNMHKYVTICIIYAQNMQIICTNMQVICILYAYICMNMHAYA